MRLPEILFNLSVVVWSNLFKWRFILQLLFSDHHCDSYLKAPGDTLNLRQWSYLSDSSECAHHYELRHTTITCLWMGKQSETVHFRNPVTSGRLSLNLVRPSWYWHSKALHSYSNTIQFSTVGWESSNEINRQVKHSLEDPSRTNPKTHFSVVNFVRFDDRPFCGPSCLSQSQNRFSSKGKPNDACQQRDVGLRSLCHRSSNYFLYHVIVRLFWRSFFPRLRNPFVTVFVPIPNR